MDDQFMQEDRLEQDLVNQDYGNYEVKEDAYQFEDYEEQRKKQQQKELDELFDNMKTAPSEPWWKRVLRFIADIPYRVANGIGNMARLLLFGDPRPFNLRKELANEQKAENLRDRKGEFAPRQKQKEQNNEEREKTPKDERKKVFGQIKNMQMVAKALGIADVMYDIKEDRLMLFDKTSNHRLETPFFDIKHSNDVEHILAEMFYKNSDLADEVSVPNKFGETTKFKNKEKAIEAMTKAALVSAILRSDILYYGGHSATAPELNKIASTITNEEAEIKIDVRAIREFDVVEGKATANTRLVILANGDEYGSVYLDDAINDPVKAINGLLPAINKEMAVYDKDLARVDEVHKQDGAVIANILVAAAELKDGKEQFVKDNLIASFGQEYGEFLHESVVSAKVFGKPLSLAENPMGAETNINEYLEGLQYPKINLEQWLKQEHMANLDESKQILNVLAKSGECDISRVESKTKLSEAQINDAVRELESKNLAGYKEYEDGSKAIELYIDKSDVKETIVQLEERNAFLDQVISKRESQIEAKNTNINDVVEPIQDAPEEKKVETAEFIPPEPDYEIKNDSETPEFDTIGEDIEL